VNRKRAHADLQQASTVEQPSAAVGVRQGLLPHVADAEQFAGLLTKNPSLSYILMRQ